MKNKSNTKTLIFSIVSVLLMIAIVVGSTFAYFQWTSGENQRTSVNITVAAGQITMHLEPENTIFQNLMPTDDCENSSGAHNIAPVAYGDTLATIVNNTSTIAIPSFKLSVKVTKGGNGELTPEILSHLHYSIVAIGTYKSTGVKGADLLRKEHQYWEEYKTNQPDIIETITGSCSVPLEVETDENQNPEEVGYKHFDDNITFLATGTFETVSTTGEWSDLPSSENEYLPREYNLQNGYVSGVSLLGGINTTSYQWFRVYVWLDNGYTATTIGNVTSDPLQDAKIEVTWSTNSKVEQVSNP